MSAFLCIIHCAIVPILMGIHSFYYAGDFVASTHNHTQHTEHAHETVSFLDILQGSHWHTLDYFFVIITLIAVYFATRKSLISWIKIGLWSAASLFVVSILLQESIAGVEYLAYFASALLIVFHFLNQRLGKRVKLNTTKTDEIIETELNLQRNSFEAINLETEAQAKKANRVSCAC